MKKNLPIYRRAFYEAWILVWRNTSLWLLGLLSLLFAGSVGLSNYLSQIMVTMGAGGRISWIYHWPFANLAFDKISAIFWLMLLIGISLVIFAGVVYISVSAKSALLLAMTDFYKKKTMPKLSNIWHRGLKFFWPILNIELVKKIALIIIVVIFGVIWLIFPYNQSIFNLVISIIALTLAILAGLAITIISVFAGGYTIVDQDKLLPAYKKSWDLFRHHLLVSLEISALLTLIDLLLIAGFALLISFSFIPSLLVWLLAGIFGSQALALFGAFFGFVVILLAITIIGSIYNTFYLSIWMYLFMEMHHEGIVGRLKHYFTGLFK